MNKSKLGVMLVTFLILIALTPLVFKKLMNSKLNEMVINLNQHGYQIKELKDESTYLTTKRYFDIKIPGKVINESVKWVEFQGFITFKNLPVTSVFMRGTLVNGKAEKYIQDAIDIFKNKLTLNVTTPNFKVFKFKADDINEKDLVLQDLNGVYEYEKNNLSYSFKKFKYMNTQIDDMKVNNVKNKTSIAFSLKDDKSMVKNVKINSLVKKDEIDANATIDMIRIMTFEIDKLKFSFDLKSTPKVINLIKNGEVRDINAPVKILTKLNIDNVMKLGDFHALVFLDAKNLRDIKNKIAKQKYDFINEFVFKMKAKEEVIKFLTKFQPQLELLNQIAKHKNGYMLFELKIKDGKVSVNNE